MPRHINLSATLDPTTYRLLNEWQRGFPLTPRPFATIAETTGTTEQNVLETYQQLQTNGLVSRVGAVFAPCRFGASALAALSVAPQHLEAVAERINRETTINHNYQREHTFNLWFVITASSMAHLEKIIAGIEWDTGCSIILLPLEEEFHIDLGFDLNNNGRTKDSHQTRETHLSHHGKKDATYPLSELERDLVVALQPGLPLVTEPFATSGAKIGMSPTHVLEKIENWLDTGLIRRFGVVVRHHELGLRANAMCVWNIPDEHASALGKALATEPAVTLCYRRRRALPHWSYNLFCMIHGTERVEVLAARDKIAEKHGLDRWPHEILFSCRRFKQTGARYIPEKETAPHA